MRARVFGREFQVLLERDFEAALAFIRHRGPWVRKGILLWLLVLYHSALYSLTVAEVRYSYALLPYVLLPAAVTLAAFRGRSGGRGAPVP